MKSRNIKWVFFSGVDNVILDIVDPILIGLTAKNNAHVSSKTLFKEDANSPDWIFAKEMVNLL